MAKQKRHQKRAQRAHANANALERATYAVLGAAGLVAMLVVLGPVGSHLQTRLIAQDATMPPPDGGTPPPPPPGSTPPPPEGTPPPPPPGGTPPPPPPGGTPPPPEGTQPAGTQTNTGTQPAGTDPATECSRSGGTYDAARQFCNFGGTPPPPPPGSTPPPPEGTPPPPEGTQYPEGTQQREQESYRQQPTYQQCTDGKFFCFSLGACANGPECEAKDREVYGNRSFSDFGGFGQQSAFPGFYPATQPSFDFDFGGEEDHFMPPERIDFSAYKDQFRQGPFDESLYDFSEFEIDFEHEGDFEPPRDFELDDLKRRGEDALREIERMEKEVSRVVKRSGNLTSCPPIAKAQAALASAKTAANVMKNASEDTLEAAYTADDKLGFGGPGGFGGGFGPPPGFGGFEGGFDFGTGFGGGFGPPPGFGGFDPSSFGKNNVLGSGLVAQFEDDSLWNKVMMSVGQSHMCEGIVHAVKEVSRAKKDLKREAKRVADSEAKAELDKCVADLSALENDPYKYVDFDIEGPYGDPMSDLFEKLDDVRFDCFSQLEDINFEMEKGDVCTMFDFIEEEIDTNGSACSADLVAKAKKRIAKGKEACATSNIGKAQEVMSKLSELRFDFEQCMDIRDEGDFEGDFRGFEDLDGKTLMQDDLRVALEDSGGDIDAALERLESLILSKVESAVQLAVDRVTQKFMTQLAEMESKFIEKVSDKLAVATDNMAKYDEEIRDKIFEVKAEINDATVELDKIVVAAEDKMAASDKQKYEQLLEYTTVRNWSEKAAVEVDKQLTAVTTAASAASDAEEAAEILGEELDTALTSIKAIYEADEKNKLKEGVCLFADVCGGAEDIWYNGDAAAANKLGILKGSPGEDGYSKMNAGNATNVAEGLAMLARAHAGGIDRVPSAVNTDDPVVAKLPEWAQSSATYLSQNLGVNLQAVVGDKAADAAMTKGEMMYAAAQVFDFDVANADAAVSRFTDAGGMNELQREGAAALVEAGCVKGEGGGNTLAPQADLNRAVFARIMTCAVKSAE